MTKKEIKQLHIEYIARTARERATLKAEIARLRMLVMAQCNVLVGLMVEK